MGCRERSACHSLRETLQLDRPQLQCQRGDDFGGWKRSRWSGRSTFLRRLLRPASTSITQSRPTTSRAGVSNAQRDKPHLRRPDAHSSDLVSDPLHRRGAHLRFRLFPYSSRFLCPLRATGALWPVRRLRPRRAFSERNKARGCRATGSAPIRGRPPGYNLRPPFRTTKLRRSTSSSPESVATRLRSAAASGECSISARSSSRRSDPATSFQ